MNVTANSQPAQGIPTALRLVASIFEREVNERLLNELIERREEVCEALGSDPLPGLDLDNRAEAIESLAIEYCRLFIGPRGHIPPVESVVLGEGRYWGPSTEAVVEFYKAAGIAWNEDAPLLPDHISMELDCLALLEERRQNGLARTFAREHLLRWLPALVEHITTNAALAFYPAWGKALKTILEQLYHEEA